MGVHECGSPPQGTLLKVTAAGVRWQDSAPTFLPMCYWIKWEHPHFSEPRENCVFPVKISFYLNCCSFIRKYFYIGIYSWPWVIKWLQLYFGEFLYEWNKTSEVTEYDHCLFYRDRVIEAKQASFKAHFLCLLQSNLFMKVLNSASGLMSNLLIKV